MRSYDQKHSHTHASNDSYEHPHVNIWSCNHFYCHHVAFGNTTPVQRLSSPSGWSGGLQCHSIYYVTKTYILQQLLRPYALHCYSNYYIPMIYIVTATITSLRPPYYNHSYTLCSILLQQLLHPYELYCYSNHYVPMINIFYVFMRYIVTATITSLRSKLSQQLQLLRP